MRPTVSKLLPSTISSLTSEHVIELKLELRVVEQAEEMTVGGKTWHRLKPRTLNTTPPNTAHWDVDQAPGRIDQHPRHLSTKAMPVLGM